MKLTEADAMFVAKTAAEAAEQDAIDALIRVGASPQALHQLLRLHDTLRRSQAVYLDALLAEQAKPSTKRDTP